MSHRLCRLLFWNNTYIHSPRHSRCRLFTFFRLFCCCCCWRWLLLCRWKFNCPCVRYFHWTIFLFPLFGSYRIHFTRESETDCWKLMNWLGCVRTVDSNNVVAHRSTLILFVECTRKELTVRVADEVKKIGSMAAKKSAICNSRSCWYSHENSSF